MQLLASNTYAVFVIVNWIFVDTKLSHLFTFQPHRSSSFNLVVRASPTHPPLALLCAANQLKSSDANSVTINCHVHSSLGNTAVPKKLASDFTSECDGVSDGGLNFRLTIVWKDGESQVFPEHKRFM